MPEFSFASEEFLRSTYTRKRGAIKRVFWGMRKKKVEGLSLFFVFTVRFTVERNGV